jgi:hypothetical protein
VLVKTYELVVDGVEVFRSERQALESFGKWTDGLTPKRLVSRENANPEEKYSQTKIFGVEVDSSNEAIEGTWECDKCQRQFRSIGAFERHLIRSPRCKGANAVR